MIAILSPAKTLNMDRKVNTELYTKPDFLEEACILMNELIKYSPMALEGLMKINSSLAEENFFRHISWKKEHDLSNSRQALLAYDGAVYHGIEASSLDDADLIFANNHIRVISGLYGVLKPLDLIQPYRLEMLTKLKNPLGDNLYKFWKTKLTEYFKDELDRQKDNIIIDLASKEYSSAIDMSKANANVITPVFKDYKRGAYKVITIYAKRARGLMTRFIIKNRIENINNLKRFNEEDYEFNERLSTDTTWFFTR